MRNEPQVRIEAPDAPEWLSDRARKEWERLTPAMVEAGILTTLDRNVLGGYCAAIAELAEMEEDIARNGYFQDAASGTQMKRPSVLIRDKAAERCLKLERELGLTPRARTGLDVKVNRDEDNPFGLLGLA